MGSRFVLLKGLFNLQPNVRLDSVVVEFEFHQILIGLQEIENCKPTSIRDLVAADVERDESGVLFEDFNK
eukprot:EC837299.1.p4 GENE.EC837299.1~~EC837299.1.p4  ORF type:complete len:70 (-),score=16.32 EC837299.1:217-426(-)